ncbi:MAG: glycosyltransferase [Methanosarcinaceae archaeon]
MKMLEAFKALGCEVDLVMGLGVERCKQIKQIKQKIKNGKKYDFVYSESSTYPTMLACGVKDALKYPLMDFRFFAFCNKNSIPIGLFYRDIYWRFPELFNKPLAKKWVLNIMYQFDLYVYQKYIAVLYLPSEKMSKYLGFDFPVLKPLPPGVSKNYLEGSRKTNQGFNNVFYVGGTNSHYGIHKLLKVVGDVPEVSLTICCREKDWQENHNSYEHLLKPNISVVHLSGDDLIPLYENADVVSLFMEKTVYRNFAMPVKLFEYLFYQKPIIATEGTAAGDFVEANGVGWVIPYDEKALERLLSEIKNNPEILIEKKNQISKILSMNTWKSRALQVCKDLRS